jgi:hypothetical protein
MTDQAVSISITIKAFDVESQFYNAISYENLEEEISYAVKQVGWQVLKTAIVGMDQNIRRHVPERWKNIGTEERSTMASLGWIRYHRRIYRDENGKRRKPVDEMLGLDRYARISPRLMQMGAWLASVLTYRQAAVILSWLIQEEVSPSTIQRMVWEEGNRIADGEEAERTRIFERGVESEKGKVKTRVLYGESDGVWLHLQREDRRSAEVRVATMYTGKRPISGKRNRLENKCSFAAIGLSSEAWQEHVLRNAHRHYDLDQVELLVTGGDGNQWVGKSFDRFAIQQESVLDRFHLARSARRALGRTKKSREITDRLRQKGFDDVSEELKQMIDRADEQSAEKLREFYQYIERHQDGLLDLEHRNGGYQPATLGVIEGTLDKLVVHRMKGRGCCWRLRGARAMLALCQHRDTLKDLAFPDYSLDMPERPRRRKKFKTDHSDWLQARMPIFFGPDQQKPWVREWHRFVHSD